MFMDSNCSQRASSRKVTQIMQNESTVTTVTPDDGAASFVPATNSPILPAEPPGRQLATSMGNQAGPVNRRTRKGSKQRTKDLQWSLLLFTKPRI